MPAILIAAPGRVLAASLYPSNTPRAHECAVHRHVASEYFADAYPVHDVLASATLQANFSEILSGYSGE
jgi:hypothetical protein